ncbi:hypothetical protein ACXJY6_17995 [Vibrio sp. RC27]
MLTRYMNMSVKSQSYLFSFGLLLTFLGMALTDLWLPMVVGAFVLTALTVESWVRILHIIPMHREVNRLRDHVEQLSKEIRKKEE